MHFAEHNIIFQEFKSFQLSDVYIWAYMKSYTHGTVRNILGNRSAVGTCACICVCVLEGVCRTKIRSCETADGYV